MNKLVINDLTLEELNTLLSGLLELPAKFSFGLISKIHKQFDEQSAGMQASQPTIASETVFDESTTIN